jgi:hypothetical protein
LLKKLISTGMFKYGLVFRRLKHAKAAVTSSNSAKALPSEVSFIVVKKLRSLGLGIKTSLASSPFMKNYLSVPNFLSSSVMSSRISAYFESSSKMSRVKAGILTSITVVV